VCHFQVEALIDRGHQVMLIASGTDGTRASFVPTFEVPPEEGGDEDAFIEVVHAARAMAALDGSHEVDIVHDHSLAGPLTAAVRSVPTVVSAHMALAGPCSQLGYLEAIARWSFLVPISDAQRRSAPHIAWMRTVHHGVSLDRYPVQECKDDYVLFLGRISREKGTEIAIEAARASGYRLVLAGRPTSRSEWRYFDERIRPRLGRGVEWVGDVGGARKNELLGGARCLVFPIDWEEPFGLVVIEAMACGTPVVALRRGSIPELVIDGVTGIVTDEPDDLGRAMRDAGSIDPKVCRSHVARSFSAERMAEDYEAVYFDVLERREHDARLSGA
jgi:glycosyltransferase involved in cell wall biosynthesis